MNRIITIFTNEAEYTNGVYTKLPKLVPGKFTALYDHGLHKLFREDKHRFPQITYPQWALWKGYVSLEWLHKLNTRERRVFLARSGRFKGKIWSYTKIAKWLHYKRQTMPKWIEYRAVAILYVYEQISPRFVRGKMYEENHEKNRTQI